MRFEQGTCGLGIAGFMDFHVIVAGGYSGIFYMNWLNNGHLPITLPEADRLELAKFLEMQKLQLTLKTIS